ncbi:MAG: chemotaxis protein CheW [Gammaproteobacteria bacterium]
MIERSPLQVLTQLESTCIAHAAPLPQQKVIQEEWSGIGFRLGEIMLASALGDVVEVLLPHAVSRIPRTKAWVNGVANVRGNLMTVIDLQSFLQGRPTRITSASRLLVIQHKGLYTGLLVDAVLGLQHFTMDYRCDESPDEKYHLQPYLTQAFRVGSEYWGVFSMRKLAEAPEFLQTAI